MYLISDGGMICNTLDTMDAIMLTKNIDIIDGVKLDVRKTKDNIYVLSKYEDLSELTYSKNKVSESSYNYLKKVKFKSFIFKYFIPRLEDVLSKYDKNKIIVLELYDHNLDNLIDIIGNYSYKYYFVSKDSRVILELERLKFNRFGVIIDNYNSLLPSNIKNNIYNNTFLLKE